MPGPQVEAYALAFNPQLGGEVKIKVRGNPQWMPPIRVQAAELAAIAAILNESPVFLTNGWIHTGDEPVGGA